MKWIKMLREGLLLGSVVATAACGDPETDAPMCMLTPGIEPQSGINGQGGTNGLDSSAFHNYFTQFHAMAQTALAPSATEPVSGTYALNPEISSGFLKDGEDYAIRSLIFEKAMQCALPRETESPEKKPGVWLEDAAKKKTYAGGGLLRTTTGWLTKALDQAAEEDLVTCIILLLNPNYKGIPVFLAGTSVSRNDQISADGYPFEEALWSASVSEVEVKFHVWPLFEGPQFPDDCSADATDPEAPWKYRVCGSDSEQCDVDVRYDRNTACEKAPLNEADKDEEHYLCDKKPAMKTRLKNVCDLNALFCPIPQ
jgi:hypothetical protein